MTLLLALVAASVALLLPVHAAGLLLVLPLSTAAPGSWPAPGSAACGGGTSAQHCGDVRAVLQVGAGDIVDGVATAQIFWRRRDPTPELKAVLVTFAATGAPVAVQSVDVESTCGVVAFTAATPGLFHAYYLPYLQSGGGAGLQFSWLGCNDTAYSESNPCVLGRRQRRQLVETDGLVDNSVCAAATPSAALAVGLENRDAFNAFTDMEMMASTEETAAAAAALSAAPGGAPFLGVFPEDRDHSVRVFDAGIPVRWVPGGGGPSPYGPTGPAFSGAPAPGEFFVFQLGLWAYAAVVRNITAVSTALTCPSAPPLPPSAVTFINLAGLDLAGVPYANTAYGLQAGGVGSLWVGVQVPPDAGTGVYSGSLALSTLGAPGDTVVVSLTLSVTGAPVPLNGAGNVTSMSRLSWLYSTRGLEDTVPPPYEGVTATAGGNATLTLTTLLKTVTVGADGLVSSVVVTVPRRTLGKPSTVVNDVLAAPVAFQLFDVGGGAPLPATLTSPATVTLRLNSSVSWTSTSSVPLPGSGPSASVTLAVSGTLDFTSYANVSITLTNGGPAAVSLGDVRLVVPVAPAMAAYIAGMDEGGAEATEYVDRVWRWSNASLSNKAYLGRPEGGLLLNLKGDGIEWDSPMFGKDFPVIPFVPTSWGGAGGAPTGNPYGVNITNATLTAFSGPRTLAPGASVTFLFDLALTPAKLPNWARHWSMRTFQVGYGTEYFSPAEMAEAGVKAVTLHQGTPGIINGSLINPWINYPFLDDTVPLLTNYTAQANALGMLSRFYYTVRELSARCVETFAFLAQQGEIMVDEDPYTIVQPGYAHAWNTHGGSAYLHQHVVTHYAACWQQTESDSSWDPSMCDVGSSRFFNYFVEGFWHSMSQPPYSNGDYFDGINFPRAAMLRVRRAADAGAVARGLGLPALLDLHTGRDSTPGVCSYASHYPLVDSVWNGEGFDFTGAPAYWLVEVAARGMGMTGDLLGAGVEHAFRGMLFGMTTRNSAWAPALWAAWDEMGINATGDGVYGWYDLVPPPVTVTGDGACGAYPPPSPGTCDWNVTRDGYFDGSPCGAPAGNLACFTDTPLLDAQAACCNNTACAGFSYGGGAGCYKNDHACYRAAGGIDGYTKPGFVPPGPARPGPLLATTYSAYGSQAVIVVASWCATGANATLAIDWAELGLDAGTTTVTAPAIPGVQSGATFASAAGPFPLTPSGGVILLLRAGGGGGG